MAPRKSSQSSRNHRSTLSLQKTEVVINVYDLLPVRFGTHCSYYRLLTACDSLGKYPLYSGPLACLFYIQGWLSTVENMHTVDTTKEA